MKTPTMLLRRVHFLIPLLVITLMVSSCNKETICSQDIPIIKQSNDQESDAMIYGPIVLGKQLENPYSIANMQKAYDMLSATKANFVRTDLQTTHFYVKFAPKDEFELNELKRDTTLFFYEYPLDYEVVVYGSYYHDPSLPEDVPTYQYVSVPADKWQILSKSSIEYEVLEELFIPDEYGDNFEVIKTKALGILTEDQIEELVSKSFEITGNSITPRTKASESWTPAGRIYYVDDATGGRVVGLEGITVKAKRWFTTHSGVTDASGYYVCDGSFKNPADYSFDLECYDFEIRGGNGVQTSFGQNNVTGNYNKCFSRSLSVLDLYVATAYRAAYYYYYKPIGGLHRPPMNGFWNTKLRIKVFNETNPSESGDFVAGRRFLGLGSAIHLYNPGHATNSMYSITIHEMAHAAHWRMVVDSPDNDNNDYSNSESRLKESWAQGVEWFITGQTYFHYDKFNSSYNNFKIFHNLIDSGYTVDYIFSYRYPGLEHYLWYTNVVIDLVDSYPNEYEYSYLYSEGDTVNGIPIATIEDALLGATTWNEWKSNIKQNYSYEIQQNIETVFGLWSLE